MSWRLLHRWGALVFTAVVGVAAACGHADRGPVATHPFRDEREPGEFRFEESAVPAGAEAAPKSSGEPAGDTSVEVEIDEESNDAAGAGSASDQADEGALGEEGDEDEGDVDEGGDEGGEDEGGEDEGRGAP